MENRFGIKDLFLLLFLTALTAVVVMAMSQFDRQYQEILTIKRQNDELTRDMVRLKSLIAQGASVAAVPGPNIGYPPASTQSSQPGAQVAVTPATQSGAPATQVAVVPPVPAVPKGDSFTHLRAAEAKPDFARGDWLVDNFSTKIGRLTPLIATDVYQAWVESQVLETLVDRDPYTLDFVPRLATSWAVSDDGLRMTFNLRRGVEFSDGEPFGADDVIYTFKLIQNPEINAERARSYLSKLKEVRKLNSHAVEFVFSEFYYLNFTTVAGTPLMAEHFYSRYKPDEFNEKTGLLFGSGPYKLENPETWSPGQPVQIYRNERYWGTSPTFNRIVFKELQGEAQEMVEYGNGKLDLIRCVPDQYKKLTADKAIMDVSASYEFENLYAGYSYVGWNQVRKQKGEESPTFFKDKRVRQAMTMLMDRERVTRDIYLGYATVASGPFAPKGPQSDPAIKPWPYDPARAKALLAEAGFADRDGNGVLESADGKPFKFKLTYPSGNETVDKTVQLLKDNLSLGGVLAELDRVDWPVLVQKLNQGDFEAVTLGWSASPESDPYQVFHSSQIAGEGDNRTNYINPELDRLIERARGTVKTEDRMKLWQQVHAILHEDQPYTFLLNRKALRLFNKRIRNIEPSKIGLNFDYMNGGMIPWYVPKGQQEHTQ